MKEKIIIACSKSWFFENKKIQKFLKNQKTVIIKKKSEFKKELIEKINPKIIFFPHWSHKVEKSITENFNCICFHTAPLPYGRGGSPIQNLIKRNFKKTPVCALKMTDDIDAGPIFIKKEILLNGNLNQIFNRISYVIAEMISILSKKKINPKPQKGEITTFKRIKENESRIENEKSLLEIYDKIRMLDGAEYPKAFIIKKKYKIFFNGAILKGKSLFCNAKIIKFKK